MKLIKNLSLTDIMNLRCFGKREIKKLVGIKNNVKINVKTEIGQQFQNYRFGVYEETTVSVNSIDKIIVSINKEGWKFGIRISIED